MDKNSRMTTVVNRLKKMKKEDYMVLVLIGILLVIIALPTEKASETQQKNQFGGTKEETEIAEMILEEKIVKNGQKTDDNICYQTNSVYIESEKYAKEMENRVQKILESISGIGKVSVMITLSNYGEEIVEKDTELSQINIEEMDAEGGKRDRIEKVQQYETIYTVDEEGNNIPYVVQTRLPSVAGVVVIAQGAGDKQVKQNIIDALEVLFNISEHKIKVIKMKS
ncbi:MAG: hypothetical protein E7299_05190 [Lachnospiraceae bacterium]|nr:hypothetical protein [Lachnospiraceae bacterium]